MVHFIYMGMWSKEWENIQVDNIPVTSQKSRMAACIVFVRTYAVLLLVGIGCHAGIKTFQPKIQTAGQVSDDLAGW